MITKLNKDQARKRMNELSKERVPYLFIIDFDFKHCQVYPLDKIPSSIHYELNGQSNSILDSNPEQDHHFDFSPVSLDAYANAFELVKKEINYGNSFLLNLSFRSLLDTTLSLSQIFKLSVAKYKLLLENELVVFSPESFVKIKDGKISSFPMKGTIDANIENAEEIILKSEKEKAEHFTIVDLIRNDLSMVSKKVKVEEFRYIDHIKSNQKDLLQVSSKITGILDPDQLDNLGNIMFALLPAGSITGAPKKKTVEIIKEAESTTRKYYTGIFGVFDGSNLDSGVMIRCIQKEEDKMYYHSGGGITHMSILEEEYQELIDKVYVPFV